MSQLSCNGSAVVTKAPEFKTIGDKNTPICTVNLAFNRVFKDANGEFQKEPCYITGKVFGKRAEYCNERLSIGTELYVSGHIQFRQFEDAKKNKRTTYEFIIDDFSIPNINKDKATKQKVETTSEPKDDDMPF